MRTSGHTMATMLMSENMELRGTILPTSSEVQCSGGAGAPPPQRAHHLPRCRGSAAIGVDYSCRHCDLRATGRSIACNSPQGSLNFRPRNRACLQGQCKASKLPGSPALKKVRGLLRRKVGFYSLPLG